MNYLPQVPGNICSHALHAELNASIQYIAAVRKSRRVLQTPQSVMHQKTSKNGCF